MNGGHIAGRMLKKHKGEQVNSFRGRSDLNYGVRRNIEGTWSNNIGDANIEGIKIEALILNGLENVDIFQN